MEKVKKLEKKLKELEKKAKKTDDYCKIKELFEEYYIVRQELKMLELDLVSKRIVV